MARCDYGLMSAIRTQIKIKIKIKLSGSWRVILIRSSASLILAGLQSSQDLITTLMIKPDLNLTSTVTFNRILNRNRKPNLNPMPNWKPNFANFVFRIQRRHA